VNYIKKNSIEICYKIGIIQAIALAVYTLWAFISALITGEIERVDTFITENFIYSIFVVSMILVANGFQKLKKFAFTPFLLIQLFVIIIGWPFVEDSDLIIKFFGFLMISLSLFALVLALLPTNRNKFYGN
jgi:hypothetical protein